MFLTGGEGREGEVEEGMGSMGCAGEGMRRSRIHVVDGSMKRISCYFTTIKRNKDGAS